MTIKSLFCLEETFIQNPERMLQITSPNTFCLENSERPLKLIVRSLMRGKNIF